MVGDEVLREYLEVLLRLGVSEDLVKRFEERFVNRTTVTRINLGARLKLSRDPDDNIMIATARSGKAEFLITNDRDLLEISKVEQRRLRLSIITPSELLARLRPDAEA